MTHSFPTRRSSEIRCGRRWGRRHCHQEREAPPPHRVSFARLGPLCKHGLHPPTRALRKVDIFRGQNRGANRLRRSVPQGLFPRKAQGRSEEHTSELQSLMRISYAVFCLKKKKK